jgi:hypothetical protein
MSISEQCFLLSSSLEAVLLKNVLEVEEMRRKSNHKIDKIDNVVNLKKGKILLAIYKHIKPPTTKLFKVYIQLFLPLHEQNHVLRILLNDQQHGKSVVLH